MRKLLLLFNCILFHGIVFQSISQNKSFDHNSENWIKESFGQYSSSDEIINRRTLNEKHFRRTDGQIDMFVSSEPINYFENGSWQTIYNTISEHASGAYKYSNTNNLFKSYYPEQIQQGFKTVLEGKEILEMQNASIFYENNGQRFGEKLINNSFGKVNGNVIVYSNVFGKGIDLMITQKGGKRKLDYIIQSKEALNSQFADADYLVFSEQIILPIGWTAKLDQGSILLLNENNEVVSLYDMPTVFESNVSNKDKSHESKPQIDFSIYPAENKNISNNEKPSETNDIVYEVISDGNVITILTKVNLSYLYHENRVFPVVVDPTLVASVAATATWWYDYIAPYGPASVSTSGAPAGSAITNVNLVLNVTATQYWDWFFGVWTSYSGNCNNYHVFGLEDVPFTLGTYTCGGNTSTFNCLNPNKTWRTVIWSADGYDYRARWGYTVTVTYETITAPTSITAPTTICQGGTTTLTATGGTSSAGSTAITTQWFTGSCGGTLIGTGASINVSPTTTTTYYARRVGQCTTTGCTSVTVTVNSNVNNPGAITAPASICVGSAANISNVTAATTGVPASAGPNYYYYWQRTSAPVVGWTMYDGPTSSLASALPAAVTGTAGTYILARNSEFGCAGQVSAPFLNLTVYAAPSLGTLSNPGPIDFCDAGGNFTTAANVSGQVGSVMWDWGSNNGVWNNNWVAGANSGICCFPKKVSNSDGNADRIRYRVTNGSCTSVTSGTILIRNRYNEVPTNLVSSSSVFCSNAAPGTITLTANFPTSINMNGTVSFYSGSCGGTLVGSTTAGSNSSSASITIAAPTTTITYYVRYEPGAGTGCSNSACVSTTVTVNTVSVAPTAITGTTTICSGGSTTLTLSGGTSGTGASAQWFAGSCGSTVIGTGNSITVSPGSTTTYFVRYTGACNTTTCASVNVNVNTLSVAPTAITGITTICSGGSTTLTLSGGTVGTGASSQWFAGSCGSVLIGTGNSITVSPGSTTTYFVRYSGACNTTSCASVTVNLNTLSTAPTITPIAGTVCPNTNTTLTAAGGTAGSGSTIYWYTGPNGTGSLLGTGSSLLVAPTITTTYYVRRQGTCNTTADASTTVNVKTFVYALNGASTNTYCTDNSGWHHFYSGDEIIFSVQGNISTAPMGFPVATINDNNAYFQQTEGPGTAPGCSSNQNPNEERFEMERSWNFDLGGGAPSGPYNIRFYYQPAERTAIENAANAWLATYPDCGYSYKYATPNGFYWFKNTGSNYSAPDYDGTHYPATVSSVSGVNYAQWTGITSFSGGSGAIILEPISALPVELTSFAAVCEEDEDQAKIQWITSTEHNSAYFALERSLDGINWDIIGQQTAAGNSTNTLTYEQFDDNVRGYSTLYYRLNQVDQNGVSKVYGPISANCKWDENDFSLFPNPAGTNVTILLNGDFEEGATFVVFEDMNGKIIKRINYSNQTGKLLNVDLNDLAPGVYAVRLLDGKTDGQIVRLIKQ